MLFFYKKIQNYLVISKICSTFAPAFGKRTIRMVPRDVNQRSVCGPKSVAQGEFPSSDAVASRNKP